MDCLGELQEKLFRSLGQEGSETSALLLQLDSAIKLMVVQFNQQNKYGKIVWSPSAEVGGCSQVELRGRCADDATSADGSVKMQVGSILQAINWYDGFNKALKVSIKQKHDDKLLQIDELRNQTIEKQLHVFKERNSDTLTSGENDPHTLNTSTKDQLLSKTRQLTNNLTKANSYLQSSILQSDLNLDDLKQQTSFLNKVNENYSQLEVVFTKTNQLVKTLNNASNKEKRDVYISIGVLCAAIAWVFWRRILKIPTKFVIWLTFKFFKGILLSLGLVQRYTGSGGETAESSAEIWSTVSEATVIATVAASVNTSVADAITEAVEEAMSRIAAHDEL